MKRKRYKEEQIISILKEHDSGASVPGIARRHGVAQNAPNEAKMYSGSNGKDRSAFLTRN